MAARPMEPTLVPLRLDSREQWLLHCVLRDRVEARRAPGGSPAAARQALRKLESGSLLFTPEELRRSREALDAYRRRRRVPPGEERDLRRVGDRIQGALAGRGASPTI